MTATEVLRRMLDERGVDYRVSATGYSIDIGPYTTAYANRSDTTLDVSLRQVTPEQAIEATLGRGTCIYEIAAFGDGKAWFKCSECGGMASAEYDPPKYCPHCGCKVVGGRMSWIAEYAKLREKMEASGQGRNDG